jgi:surfeit locus 1 family protein
MTDTRPARFPLLSTILVVVAVAVMIGLGVWQWGRSAEKERELATYAANVSAPATALPPIGGPVPAAMKFRSVSANCVSVTNWRIIGGLNVDGNRGFRRIADCATGAEGPGFVADMGIAQSVEGHPAWTGGIVRGRLGEEPVDCGAVASALRRCPVRRPMIVSVEPLPGLVASRLPDPNNVPNNHIAYAVQWFLFAAAAAIIYLIALRQRRRRSVGAGGVTPNNPS